MRPDHVWCGTDLDEDDKTDALTDASDVLFERVDMAMDQNENQKQSAMAEGAPEAVTAWTSPRTTGRRVQFMHAANIRRPQLLFADKIDNSEDAIFVPKLTSKPNAIVPLEQSLKLGGGAAVATAEKDSPRFASHLEKLGLGPDQAQYPHPYQTEIESFEPSGAVLARGTVREVAALVATPLTWVDTESALVELARKLDTVPEFAVDLEAHNYRTFASFTCLMQLSTPDEDFLVDALALRASMQVLNSSFTNPKIVKVLHGADSDVQWLQKDLGLYLVGMFDTGQAMRVLDFERKSLAYLLKHYCGVVANKAFQLADWRIRPLDPEMLQYAREDTHYLLHCYDRLRAELIDRGNAQANLLRSVWDRSKVICLQRYIKPTYSPSSAMTLYNKHNRGLSSTQLRVFKALHLWRDRVARLEDESVRYVLPDHQLFELASVMPTEQARVLACCQSAGPLVRLHIQGIIEAIEGGQVVPAKEASQVVRRSSSSGCTAAVIDGGAAAKDLATRASAPPRKAISWASIQQFIAEQASGPATLAANLAGVSCIARGLAFGASPLLSNPGEHGFRANPDASDVVAKVQAKIMIDPLFVQLRSAPKEEVETPAKESSTTVSTAKTDTAPSATAPSAASAERGREKSAEVDRKRRANPEIYMSLSAAAAEAPVQTLEPSSPRMHASLGEADSAASADGSPQGKRGKKNDRQDKAVDGTAPARKMKGKSKRKRGPTDQTDGIGSNVASTSKRSKKKGKKQGRAATTVADITDGRTGSFDPYNG